MASRISIYSKNGAHITELDAYIDRTWKINEYASASFSLALTDPKATLINLEFGNIVYVEHDKLSPWIGTIETPRTWGYGTVTVNCLSAEYILKGRLCAVATTLTGTAGNIFIQLINIAESYAPGILKIGSVYTGGPSDNILNPYEPIYDTILELLKYPNFSGSEWDITPSFDTLGRLHLNCNWYNHQGITQIARLIEDTNIKLVDNVFTEQGDFYNYVIVYGSTGSTWASKSKAIAQDAGLIARHGIRMGTVAAISSIVSQSDADAALSKLKNPRKTFNLTVLDDVITPANSVFYNIRIGDTLPLDLFSVGFTGGALGLTTNVRVLGMSYKDADNQLTLVCDEIIL